MKIQIKTLKSKKYDLEVKADETVEEVKEKIEKELELGEASMMSLIHHGKILKNEQTATDVGFKENDFVVLMLKKKKKKIKKKEKVSESTPVNSNAAASTDQSTVDSAAPVPETAEADKTPAQENQGSTNGANAFVMGSQLNEAVQNLVAMGFPEADVQRAMRAAFNNPERAAEYLLNGIPQNLASGTLGQAAATEPSAAQTFGGNQPAVGNSTSAAAANPQLGEMQRMIAQNPQNMAAMLQNLMRTQPELFQGIGANGNINPEAIENLLRDENFMRMMVQAMAGGAVPGGEAASNSLGAVGLPVANPNVLRLTPTESASVDRLKLLGFSKQQAVEAFLVCNKNEQMAANYLFENVNDFAAPPVSAPATGQLVPTQQPVNSEPVVAPTVRPVASEEQTTAEQKTLEQASDSNTGAPQQDEAMAKEGVNLNAATGNNEPAATTSQTEQVDVNQGVNQAGEQAERPERNEAKNNNNADGAPDAKDEEMGEPNK